MFHSNRTTRTVRASVATVLCAALATTAVIAATPKLQTIDVTPAAKTISVGQKQTFTAMGTFSNGSKHALGPALIDISAGQYDTCALLASGGVECWGSNEKGQLGDGTTNDSLIPRAVTGIGTATAVSVNVWNACAVLASGAVKCWGYDGAGELGDGVPKAMSTTPVTVVGISTATAVGVGAEHSCALLAGGTVQCWGAGGDGQLGNGVYSGSYVPVTVTGISTATALSVGWAHTCALLASGEVQCWGANQNGTLGNNTTTHSSTPVTVSSLSGATAVSAGETSSCALTASGEVKCWGSIAGWDQFNFAVGVGGLGGPAKAVASSGNAYVCVVLRTGSVKCFGANYYGQLGNPTAGNPNPSPVLVQGINSPTKLVTGEEFTCALFSGGMMKCWGYNYYGQLGNRRPNYNSNPLPVTVVGTPGVVWNSSNTTKATITDRGVATGRAAGNTTITATTPGLINDNAVLTVK